MAEADTNRIPVNLKLLTRFFSKVKIDPSVTWNGTPCWLWTCNPDKDGYGRFWIHDQSRAAHNISHGMFIERIPPNLVTDHLCRVRHCVNPVHLESVTNGENVLRGDTFPRANAEKTHCVRGHEFTKENTHLYKGIRVCRTCKQILNQKFLKGGRVKSHCRKGHPYTRESRGRGKHRCDICIHDLQQLTRSKTQRSET